jgi:hypothetical protein
MAEETPVDVPDDLLIVAELRRTDAGHEYVLSRWPDKVELAAIFDVFPAHQEALAEVVDDLLYTATDTIQVEGLTGGARPRVERAVYDLLTAAHNARMEGLATIKGGEWGQQRALVDAAAEDAIRASLDRLPVDLP